jgi:hypothetical protein
MLVGFDDELRPVLLVAGLVLLGVELLKEGQAVLLIVESERVRDERSVSLP